MAKELTKKSQVKRHPDFLTPFSGLPIAFKRLSEPPRHAQKSVRRDEPVLQGPAPDRPLDRRLGPIEPLLGQFDRRVREPRVRMDELAEVERRNAERLGGARQVAVGFDDRGRDSRLIVRFA